VVLAVVDLGLFQVEASRYYGVNPHTPRASAGAGRVLSPEQEQEMRPLVVDSTPQEQQIASETWTRQTVAELITSRLSIELTLQGVGKYLHRWGLMPQQSARQAREQHPEEVRPYVKQELIKEQMPESSSEFRNTIDKILDCIASMSDRIWDYFKKSKSIWH
jgi:transposase